jgi:hypothetical protein
VSSLEQLTVFGSGKRLKIGREFKAVYVPANQILAQHFFIVYKQKTQTHLNQ